MNRSRRAQWRRALADGLPAGAIALLLLLSVLAIAGIVGGEGARAPAAGDAPALPVLRLDGAPAHGHVALPPARDARRARRILLVPRDPVGAIWLQGPGWRGEPRRFFAPAAEGSLPVAYVFALPAGAGELELHAEGGVPASLAPRVVGEAEALDWTRRMVALCAIAYTGTFCLALLAAALQWVVREQVFGYLFLASLATGLAFAAHNGHLYALPGLHWFGLLGIRGLWALGLAASAGTLALVGQVAGLRGEPEARSMRRGLLAIAALAALLLPDTGLPAVWGQALVEAVSFLVCAVAAWLLARSARAGMALALPALALLAIVLAAMLARILLAHGVLPDSAWSRYGYQLASLGLLTALGLQLMARIGAYREQRDRERDARIDSERRAQREAARAALTRALQARLRELPTGDVAWTAFRLLLEHLLPHVPVRRAMVLAYGYHGRDLVVTDPMDDATLAADLQGARLLMLKRRSLTGRPWQHLLGTGDRQCHEALVPLAADAHGWGALLLHREGTRGFEDEELDAALEFVRLTVLHANEAVATHALRRTAEVDPLTGAHGCSHFP